MPIVNMHKNSKTHKFCLFFVGCLMSSQLWADKFIEVQGVGAVPAAPDSIAVQASIEALSPTVQAAKQRLDTQVEHLLKEAKKQGINKQYIDAGVLYVQPRYRREQQQQVFEGYLARRSLNINFTDLASYPAWLEILAKANVSRFSTGQPYFSQPAVLQRQALQLAVEDARMKAEVLALEAGLTLGAVKQIVELSASPLRPERRVMSMAADSSGSYQSAEQAVTVHIVVTFQAK